MHVINEPDLSRQHRLVMANGIVCRSPTRERAEPLAAITAADEVAKGFPDKDTAWFVEMFCRHNRVTPETVVNRIEFVCL